MKLECRWCKYWVDDKIRDTHEHYCSGQRMDEFDEATTKAAAEYAKHQLSWSISMAQRWRSLPGKGWGALEVHPMVEYLGKVGK